MTTPIGSRYIRGHHNDGAAAVAGPFQSGRNGVPARRKTSASRVDVQCLSADREQETELWGYITIQSW